jgi:hypothetical protein
VCPRPHEFTNNCRGRKVDSVRTADLRKDFSQTLIHLSRGRFGTAAPRRLRFALLLHRKWKVHARTRTRVDARVATVRPDARIQLSLHGTVELRVQVKCGFYVIPPQAAIGIFAQKCRSSRRVFRTQLGHLGCARNTKGIHSARIRQGLQGWIQNRLKCHLFRPRSACVVANAHKLNSSKTMLCCLCLERLDPWAHKRARLQLVCGHVVHSACWDGHGCALCKSNDSDMHNQLVSFSAGICVGVMSVSVSIAALLWVVV